VAGTHLMTAGVRHCRAASVSLTTRLCSDIPTFIIHIIYGECIHIWIICRGIGPEPAFFPRRLFYILCVGGLHIGARGSPRRSSVDQREEDRRRTATILRTPQAAVYFTHQGRSCESRCRSHPLTLVLGCLERISSGSFPEAWPSLLLGAQL